MTYIKFITYLFPVLLIGFTFAKAKVYGVRTFNENAYSLTQSKAIQGFAALAIMFHHLAQHTCAPWLSYPRVKGLEPFLNIGYLMVGIFFFASGFGLFKSVKSKDGYLKNFFKKRFLPLIYFYLVTNIIVFLVTKHLSTYTWFVYAIAISYIGFFLAFRFIKNDHIAIIFTAIVSIAYVYVVDFIIGFETFWFNSSLVFVIGIIFAKYEKTLMELFKKYYWVVLILLVVAFVFAFRKSIKMNDYLGTSEATYNNPVLKLKTALMQSLTALLFSLAIIVLNLKVELRNGLLGKMGGMTLGFYLIHPLFCDLFCWATFFPKYRRILYIKNIPLYVVSVFITSMLVTIILYKVYDLITKKEKSHGNKDSQ